MIEANYGPLDPFKEKDNDPLEFQGTHEATFIGGDDDDDKSCLLSRLHGAMKKSNQSCNQIETVYTEFMCPISLGALPLNEIVVKKKRNSFQQLKFHIKRLI